MDANLQSIGDMALMQAQRPATGALMPPANTRLGVHMRSPAAIDKAAHSFEGMFMSQMLEPMFNSVPVDPMFGGGHGEEVMRSFLVQQYGKIMSQSGHLGIADAVKREMIRAQSVAAGKTAGKTTGAAAGGQNAVVQ